MIRPGRPRRRVSDGIDAGFRVSISLFLDWLWVFLVAIMATSDQRGTAWVVAALIGGLPLCAVNVFAFLTMRAYFDDRLWLRAQRATEDTPSPGSGV